MVYHSLILIFKVLIAKYGYIALFFSSLISASTVIIPLPLYILIFFASGLGLNPLLASIVAGIGSGIGEITGYWVGQGGRQLLNKKMGHKHIKIGNKHIKVGNLETFLKKYGFFAVLAIGILPFPFDIIGIICGATNFDVKKFLLGSIISKIIKNILIAYAGFFALPFIEIYLHPLAQ